MPASYLDVFPSRCPASKNASLLCDSTDSCLKCSVYTQPVKYVHVFWFSTPRCSFAAPVFLNLGRLSRCTTWASSGLTFFVSFLFTARFGPCFSTGTRFWAVVFRSRNRGGQDGDRQVDNAGEGTGTPRAHSTGVVMPSKLTRQSTVSSYSTLWWEGCRRFKNVPRAKRVSLL